MTDKSKDNIVRVAHASNPAEAHIWQNALEEEGIQCNVVGDFLNAGLGDIPGMKAEIWVHEKDLQRAREIIESQQGARTEEEEEEE